MVTHAPQLFPVFDSEMTGIPEVLWLAQARTLYVPAEAKV